MYQQAQTPSQIRHAKCLQPTRHPSLTRKRRTITPEVNIQPGSLALAQIRSLPLNVCHIRGQHESRASYVVNAEQVRSKLSLEYAKVTKDEYNISLQTYDVLFEDN